MRLSSFFNKAEIEGYPKSEITESILGMMCCKMSSIGIPKLISMR